MMLMKQLSSADFRKTYARESEPIEVTAYGKVIGTWFPAGAEIPAPSETPAPAPEAEATPEAPARFSIRPVKSARPVLVAKEKPILDPLEMRKMERERWSQLHKKRNPRAK